MKAVLEYYLDKNLTKRVQVNEIGQPIFDWGEVIAGQRKEKTVFVKNVSNDRVSLRQPYSSDEDFKIIDFPVHLKGQESATMKFEYAPSWHRTKPLDTDWGFELVIG